MDGLWPDMIAGTEALLLSNSDSVYVVELASGERTALAEGRMGRWVPTGFVAFLRGTELWAVQFDRRALRPDGNPFPVVPDVRHEAGGRGGAHYAVSTDGTLVYASGPYLSDTRFAWADADGSADVLPFPAANHAQFELSPDETELAIQIDGDIWIYDLSRGVARRLTSDGNNFGPAWSPDGRWIAVAARRDTPGLYRMLSAGTGQKELVLERPTSTYAYGYPSWTQDMSSMIFLRWRETEYEAVVLHIASGRLDVAAASRSRLAWPVLSPDGRWLAYTSIESGTEHVYVEPYPPTGERWQVSAEGGSEEPRWFDDGTQLVFRSGRRLMSATIETSPRFQATRPRTVLEAEFVNVPGWSWDMSADGPRFLVLQSQTAPRTSQTLQVVLDFARELETTGPGR